jgi:serine/threonine protein kinase/Tol biopolymer transport system component
LGDTLTTEHRPTSSALGNAPAALPDFEPYHTIGVLGEGGMGIVYLAEQHQPVRRRVALKVLKSADAGSQVLARFASESQALALMDHPHIARIYDAGTTAGGRPYFAMEYVPGIPITDYCDRNLLGFRERLTLFQQVCQAVHHAHQKGVIHRDLKPSNVLVMLQEGAPVPKVIDFGVAKAVNQRLTEKTLFTEIGMLIGTPEYMSPEQADLTGLDIDSTTDVYSLGVLLYELLVGALPFDSKSLRKAGYAEIQRVIRETEPPKPSARLSTMGEAAQQAARHRRSDVRSLIRLLRGDLEWITMKALEKDRTRRYASAADFAADITRHLGHEPVTARRPEIGYRIRKFVRRHRGLAAAAATVAAALFIGAAVARLTTRQPPPVKVLQAERLTANTPELAIQAAAISPDGQSIAYSDRLGIHVRSVASGATRLLPATAGHTLMRWLPDGKSVQTKIDDAVEGTATMLVLLQGGAPTRVPVSDTFVVSPDGTHRATLSLDYRRISVQDVNGGNWRELLRMASDRIVDQFQWSPNGKQIAISSVKKVSDGDLTESDLELIDIANGQRHVLVAAEKKLAIGSIVWASPTRVILSIDEDLGVNIYNSNLWEIRLNRNGDAVPNGLHRLTAWTDCPIRSGSLSTDGKRLVFIRSVRQRDVYVAPLEEGGKRMGTPRRLTLDLRDDYPTDWTSDSRTVIFTSARNGMQGIFRQDLDKETAEQIVVMPGSQILARITSDGNSVLFKNYDPATRTNQLMRVPIAGGTPEKIPNTEHFGVSYRCAPAGLCIMGQKKGQEFIVSELDLAKGKGREIYRSSQVVDFYPSPDGKWLASSSGTGSATRIILRSSSTGAVVREIPLRGVTKLTSVHFSADGRGFFCGDGALNEIRELYVDLAGNTFLLWRQPGANTDTIIWGKPSPDGKFLAMPLLTDDSNVYTVEDL